MLLRPATPHDLPAITAIYNDAILTTTSTFDTQPKSLEDRQVWLATHGGKYSVLVAEENSLVLGWASLSPYSDRCAYVGTAESSVYIARDYRSRGIGRALMQAILAEGARAGFHTVLARISSGNTASIHLHESLGFDHVGLMREVGRKFGQLLDVHIMQIFFPEKQTP